MWAATVTGSVTLNNDLRKVPMQGGKTPFPRKPSGLTIQRTWMPTLGDIGGGQAVEDGDFPTGSRMACPFWKERQRKSRGLEWGQEPLGVAAAPPPMSGG